MDYIKERKVIKVWRTALICFNPCCDGLYKRTDTLIEYDPDAEEFQSLL